MVTLSFCRVGFYKSAMILDFKLNESKHFFIKNYYCQQSDKSGDKPCQLFLPMLYKYLI